MSDPLHHARKYQQSKAPVIADMLGKVAMGRHHGIEKNTEDAFFTTYSRLEMAFLDQQHRLQARGAPVPWVMAVQVNGYTVHCGYFRGKQRNHFGVHALDADKVYNIRCEIAERPEDRKTDIDHGTPDLSQVPHVKQQGPTVHYERPPRPTLALKPKPEPKPEPPPKAKPVPKPEAEPKPKKHTPPRSGVKQPETAASAAEMPVVRKPHPILSAGSPMLLNKREMGERLGCGTAVALQSTYSALEGAYLSECDRLAQAGERIPQTVWVQLNGHAVQCGYREYGRMKMFCVHEADAEKVRAIREERQANPVAQRLEKPKLQAKQHAREEHHARMEMPTDPDWLDRRAMHQQAYGKRSAGEMLGRVFEAVEAAYEGQARAMEQAGEAVPSLMTVTVRDTPITCGYRQHGERSVFVIHRDMVGAVTGLVTELRTQGTHAQKQAMRDLMGQVRASTDARKRGLD